MMGLGHLIAATVVFFAASIAAYDIPAYDQVGDDTGYHHPLADNAAAASGPVAVQYAAPVPVLGGGTPQFRRKIARKLRKGSYSERVNGGAPVYLAAVMEHLVREALGVAGNSALDDDKTKITAKHITSQLDIWNTAEETNESGKAKKKGNYKRFINKILKQVHPDIGLNRKAKSIMNSFVNEVFERFATEASELAKASQLAKENRSNPLRSREIEEAVRTLLPDELADRAVSEVTKVLNKRRERAELAKSAKTLGRTYRVIKQD